MESHFKEVVYSTSKEALRRTHRNTADWIWGHRDEIEKLLEEKKRKHLQHLQDNFERSRAALPSEGAEGRESSEEQLVAEKSRGTAALANNHDYCGLFTGLKAI